MSSDRSSFFNLFSEIHSRFPRHLTPNGWYILTISALTTVSNPENISYLYDYLMKLPEYSTSAQRKILSRRLREQYLKQWVLTGIPRTIMGVLALARAEKLEDADDSFTRTDATMDENNRQRGIAFLKMLYGEDLEKIYRLWGAHAADFVWLSEHFIYGMFIGNTVVLSVVESELITYTSIACQNLGPTARIHLKALRRCGISIEDVERITGCAKIIAQWHGQDTSNWASIRDVEVAEGIVDDVQGPTYDQSQYLGL